MANLTSTTAEAFARSCQKKVSAWDMNHAFAAATGAVIFPCAMVALNTAGLITRAGGALAGFNGGVRGRAKRQLGNLSNPALAGDIAEYEQGIFLYGNPASITIASRGLLCYAPDDNNVNLTNTNITAGVIYDVDTAGVWVAIGIDLRTA
jgi:hypothetical protein